MHEILTAYLVTFGWALVGSISMGIGIIITIKLFDFSTKDVDEWELIKKERSKRMTTQWRELLVIG